MDGIETFYFYRLHFKVSGRMLVGRNAYLYVSREASFSRGKSFTVSLYFPLAGEFQARGSLKVRDIFGLTRVRFGEDSFRKLTVQPEPFKGKVPYSIDAVGGFEDKSRQRSSDVERYYMREYIPGDRFRDINWKSSSRLSQLITKISPYTQEKTRIIPVELRHFRRNRKETVESLVHLNQIKSWLLFFLRGVKNENPEYQFLIRTGRGALHLETNEDIERFSLELSSLFFQNEPSGYQIDNGLNEVYIFSTPYDKNLSTAAAAYGKAYLHIFRTVPDLNGGGREIHLLKSPVSMPLPGQWIFFRDRALTRPGMEGLVKLKIEEYPLKVKLF